MISKNITKIPTTRKTVLDQGYIELIASMGNDTSISNSARVTEYYEEWRGEADEKLLRYMYKNKHTTPFEHVVFHFLVKLPIFVARQWMRHRTWSFNEISARYQVMEEVFYIPDLFIIGTQAKKNHQARNIDFVPPNAQNLRECIETSCIAAFSYYKELIDQGCPRELARGVLPVNTYTRFTCTVNLHNLLHFLRLRLHKHAQYEIRVYAEAIKNIIQNKVPFVVQLLEEELENE